MKSFRKTLILCLLIALMTGFVSASNDLKVYYLNTTHGDATLLESSGHFMMINSGDKQDSSIVSDYLKGTGVGTLDYAIASNLNESAIGGMSNLMGEFPVSIYIDPGTSYSSASHDAILKKIEDDQIGYQQASPGTSLPFGSATIQILNVSTSAKDASKNAMEILVGVGNVSFLFTGNKNFVSTQAKVWSAPNQGEDGSIDALSTVSPEVLVISTGMNGPGKKTLDVLKKQKTNYFLTNKDGNIVISTDGVEYNVTTSNEKVLQKPTPSASLAVKPSPIQTKSPVVQNATLGNQS